MNTSRIAVLLADDHVVVREGLRKLLEAESDIEVIGEAATGREAVDMAVTLRPDVVVMDIAMPVLNGLEATRQIRKAVPGVRVLVLSAYSDDAYVETVMALGASGYVVKQTSAHFLAEAIRVVQKGGSLLSPAVVRHLDRRKETVFGRNGLEGTRLPRMTSREVEVLRLIAGGKGNKQIAADLGISIKTVEKHRDHLMRKLDIHDTAGLTRYAITVGIVASSAQLTILHPAPRAATRR